jgi:hypothetical protein
MSDLVDADELERQLDAAVGRVDNAAGELQAAQRVLNALLTIKASLEGLNDKGFREGTDIGSLERSIRSGTSSLGVHGVGIVGLSGSGTVATGIRYSVEATAPKKVRSTGMVVDIVNEAHGSLSVEDVLKRFEERHGIPEAWTNPRNAINTALNRAASKGLIATETGGRYVSAASFDVADIENMTLIGPDSA